MSKIRQIQKNKMKQTQINNRNHKLHQEQNNQQSQESEYQHKTKQHINNWLLFGFIGVMCLIWGILYWIFIV